MDQIDSKKDIKHCAVDGCLGKMHGNNWCTKHYHRVNKHGDPLYGEKERHTSCIVPGCGGKVRSGYSEYCEMHYGRIRRNGTIHNLPQNDRVITSEGYVKIKKLHVLSDGKGWVYEHRLILFEKIGPGKHNCHWCGKEVDFDKKYPEFLDALVADHLDNNHQNNNPENLVPSCNICNVARGFLKMKATMQARGIKISWNGEEKLLGAWAKEIGIHKNSLIDRLSKWPIDIAMTKPNCGTGPKKKSLQEVNHA